MNLCLFFEGTGRGVAGCITNVTRLRDLCVDDSRQKLHLEAGPGTHFGSYLAGKIAGVDWRTTFRSARRWFEANYETLPKDGIATKVFLFGFSRGALIARHFAAWLDKLGVAVAYLGLWDTVDSTVGLDVAADCPRNVKKARHAVSRDETRRFFQYVPLKGGKGQVAAKARRISRRPARRPRRGLESLGRVRPRPPQFTPNQIALRLQRTLNGRGD